MNHYPLWKYIFVVVALCIGIVYALPNIYGDDPAIQISGSMDYPVADTQAKILSTLQDNHLATRAVEASGGQLLIRFASTDVQLKAQSVVKAAIGSHYTVALNLAPATPAWLRALHASPMKLGLDLRGGVHFLLDVDTDSVVSKEIKGDMRQMDTMLRSERIRYHSTFKGQTFLFRFKTPADLDAAYKLLSTRFSGLTLLKSDTNGKQVLTVQVTPEMQKQIRDRTIDQTLTILRNRVNQLGVSEPLVQRQGINRIAVDLPGIQDTTRAKQILGGTATLEFHLVDSQHDVSSVIGGIAPVGSKLYHMKDGTPILLKNEVVLSGNAITSASGGIGQDGRPQVSITATGSQVANFIRVTGENVGQRLAIVYIETKPVTKTIDGKTFHTFKRVETVISAPNIEEALGNNFQITGLEDPSVAANLAILLRSGALIAPIQIAEERTVGPSLGQENIDKGLISLAVGMGFIILFMMFYYRLFGVIADMALIANLILLVAVLSIIGATLTLPGMAGMVLTVGMAVDANVLINERIREELRLGLSPLASIHAGYERAFATIVDANVTSLIVGMVLYGVGTGPIKGFAVVLIIGLLTSMLTAVTFTRAIVNLVYGRSQKTVKKLSIGI